MLAATAALAKYGYFSRILLWFARLCESFIIQDLEKFGVDPDNIMNGILDSNYKELMKYQIARARFYYKQAARGIPMLSPEGRLPVQVSAGKKRKQRHQQHPSVASLFRGWVLFFNFT